MNGLYAVGIGGLSVQYHPITLTLAGYAHGRKTARKTSARPRNGRASKSAKATPSTSLASVVAVAKPTVTSAARQNSASTARSR